MRLTVIKHVMATDDLGVELTNHACEENHGNTRHEEDVDDPVGKAPKTNGMTVVSVGSSAKFDNENNQDDHKLATEKVSIEVIALIDELGASVCHRVALLVKFGIDGSEADEGTCVIQA